MVPLSLLLGWQGRRKRAGAANCVAGLHEVVRAQLLAQRLAAAWRVSIPVCECSVCRDLGSLACNCLHAHDMLRLKSVFLLNCGSLSAAGVQGHGCHGAGAVCSQQLAGWRHLCGGVGRGGHGARGQHRRRQVRAGAHIGQGECRGGSAGWLFRQDAGRLDGRGDDRKATHTMQCRATSAMAARWCARSTLLPACAPIPALLLYIPLPCVHATVGGQCGSAQGPGAH